MTLPTVSIGLPVYNGASYLQDAISSVLAQDYADFELVISDNASTDETSAICRSAAEKDSRIRYVRQPENIGAIRNYQAVLDMARGRYFKWAAHDDLLESGFISACVDALEQDPGLILAYPSTVLIDAEGQASECYIDRLDSDDEDPVLRFAQWMKWGNHLCNPIFGLMPRDQLEKCRPMGAYAGSDHVFLAEIALAGRCKRLPVGYMLRRLHGGMSSQSQVGSLAVAGWMSGQSLRGLRFRWWRLLREYGTAIWRSGMTPSQKLRAATILGNWACRFSSKLFKELLLPLYINGAPTGFNMRMRRLLGIQALKHQRKGRP